METEHTIQATEFGRWLKTQMKRRGISITDLATAIGTRTGTVSRWTNSQRIPEPSMTIRIADALALDPDVVLSMAGHRPLRKATTTTDIMQELQSIERTYMERVQGLREELQTIAGVGIALTGSVPAPLETFRQSRGSGRVRILEEDLGNAYQPFATTMVAPIDSLGILPGDIVFWSEPRRQEPPADGDIVLASVNRTVQVIRWSRAVAERIEEVEVLGRFITYKPNPQSRMRR